MVRLVPSLSVEKTPSWYGTYKCKYIECPVADSRQRVVPRCRLGEELWIIATDIHHFIYRYKRHWISMHCSVQGTQSKKDTGWIDLAYIQIQQWPLSCNTFYKSGGFSWTAKLLKPAYPRNEVDESVSLFHILDTTGWSFGFNTGSSFFSPATTRKYRNTTSD